MSYRQQHVKFLAYRQEFRYRRLVFLKVLEPPLHDGGVIPELEWVRTNFLKPNVQKSPRSRQYHRENRVLRHFPDFSHDKFGANLAPEIEI